MKHTKRSFNETVARLTRVLRRRLTGSIFLQSNIEGIAALPVSIEDTLRGLVGDMEETDLPAQMRKAQGQGTDDQPVIDLLILLESFMHDFSLLSPALSAFLVSVHSDEIIWRIKKKARPENLWTSRMDDLAVRLDSVSERWLAIASRKVRGKTAETKWLLEVSKVLAEANWICTEIFTVIIETAIEGDPR